MHLWGCMKRKFIIHPSSLIIWLWLFVFVGPIMALSYILCVAVHEAGHFFVAKALGYKLSNFSLCPYGVALNLNGQTIDNADEYKIALAGPLANLVFAFLVFGLWWCFPNLYGLTYPLVEISVVLALVNLLPAYPLDGGRIFMTLTRTFLSGKVAGRLTKIFNIILSAGFFVLFFVMCFINFNPTFLMFAVFLVMGFLDLSFVTKYEKINIFCKKNKNFSKPTIYVVSLNTKLCELLSKIKTTKVVMFCLVLENGRIINLSEKMIINLSLKFDLNTQLFEIF